VLPPVYGFADSIAFRECKPAMIAGLQRHINLGMHGR
jgi:hypothetical protein